MQAGPRTRTAGRVSAARAGTAAGRGSALPYAARIPLKWYAITSA